MTLNQEKSLQWFTIKYSRYRRQSCTFCFHSNPFKRVLHITIIMANSSKSKSPDEVSKEKPVLMFPLQPIILYPILFITPTDFLSMKARRYLMIMFTTQKLMGQLRRDTMNPLALSYIIASRVIYSLVDFLINIPIRYGVQSASLYNSIEAVEMMEGLGRQLPHPQFNMTRKFYLVLGTFNFDRKCYHELGIFTALAPQSKSSISATVQKSSSQILTSRAERRIKDSSSGVMVWGHIVEMFWTTTFKLSQMWENVLLEIFYNNFV